jgi:large subunit ribosomal protein L15
MKLHDLQPAPGSKKARKRVGRGHSSGQGKTAGRGTKGQNARSGGSKGPFFEGGQLPLVRRLPFARGVGFTNRWRVDFVPINIGWVAEHFEAGQEVSPETLTEVGKIKKATQLIAVLADGELDKAVHVKAHRVSKAAREKIEAAGGTVEILPRT